MILYWAWPPDGAGHAAKAAAICRHLTNDVLVIRGTDDPRTNMALDHFGIPYTVIERKAEAAQFVYDNHRFDFIVYDDYPGTKFDRYANLYIWRMNRRNRMGGVPTIRVEGAGSMWPVLMLEDHEILSREDARDALGIPQDQFTIIGVTSTARPGVVEAAGPDFLLTPENFWPALKYLRAADHIVGCIGYNLYAEVKYLGIDVTWIKAPNSPDQAIRMFDQFDMEPRVGVGREIAAMIDEMHGQGVMPR